MPSTQLNPNRLTLPILQFRKPAIALCKHRYGQSNSPLVVVVNYSPNQSQCNLQLPFDELCGHKVRARDLMNSVVYERDGTELVSRGMFLDLPPRGYHVFTLETLQ